VVEVMRERIEGRSSAPACCASSARHAPMRLGAPAAADRRTRSRG
jgi:hypothetical protein